MTQRTGRNNAVDTRADGDSHLSCAAVQVNGLIEHSPLERRLHDGECIERFASQLKCAFIAKTLEDFLYDRQTRDDFLEVSD